MQTEKAETELNWEKSYSEVEWADVEVVGEDGFRILTNTEDKVPVAEHLQLLCFNPISEANMRHEGEEKPAADRIPGTDALEVW